MARTILLLYIALAIEATIGGLLLGFLIAGGLN